jgi:hypothetical protein
MKKVLLTYVLILVGVGVLPPSLLLAEPKTLSAMAFDFDNTVMHTNSLIHLFHYQNGQRHSVSTGDFADVKPLVGKDGPYLDYGINGEQSFVEFRDRPDRNVILDTVRDTVQSKPKEIWQGPAWDVFVKASNDPEQAKRLSIITARGHASNQFRDALGYLSSLGYFKYLPREEYIFNVGGSTEKDAQGMPKSIEQLKVEAMLKILDDLQSEVVRRRSAGEDIRGSFVFYDDDFTNVDKAQYGLTAMSNRWPDIELNVAYVGNRKDVPALMRVERPEKLRPACRGALNH